MDPVCTIMVGRVDDWLKVLTEKENITIDPGYFEWAGVAVFNKTYHLFRARRYRIRLTACQLHCCNIASPLIDPLRPVLNAPYRVNLYGEIA
jgi:hypothetical protein